MTFVPATWVLTIARGLASATIVLMDLALLKGFPSSDECCPGNVMFLNQQRALHLQHKTIDQSKQAGTSNNCSADFGVSKGLSSSPRLKASMISPSLRAGSASWAGQQSTTSGTGSLTDDFCLR